MAYKLVSKAYYSPTGLSAPSKIYPDVHAINKAITLDLVRQWFSENVQKTNKQAAQKAAMLRKGLSSNFKLTFLHNGKANGKPAVSVWAFYDRRFFRSTQQ